MLVKVGFMIIFVAAAASAGVDGKNTDKVRRLRNLDVLQKLTRW